jgi:hypothetical protein
VSTESYSERCTDVTELLLVVIEHDLVPLAKDKKYVRSLSKLEAKAIYPFLDTWSTLKSDPPTLDVRKKSLNPSMLLTCRLLDWISSQLTRERHWLESPAVLWKHLQGRSICQIWG